MVQCLCCKVGVIDVELVRNLMVCGGAAGTTFSPFRRSCQSWFRSWGNGNEERSGGLHTETIEDSSGFILVVP